MGNKASKISALQILKVTENSTSHKLNILPFFHTILEINKKPVSETIDGLEIIKEWEKEDLDLLIRDLRKGVNFNLVIHKRESDERLGLSINFTENIVDLFTIKILKVIDGSPAQMCGLLRHDYILGVEGEPNETESKLLKYIEKRKKSGMVLIVFNEKMDIIRKVNFIVKSGLSLYGCKIGLGVLYSIPTDDREISFVFDEQVIKQKIEEFKENNKDTDSSDDEGQMPENVTILEQSSHQTEITNEPGDEEVVSRRENDEREKSEPGNEKEGASIPVSEQKKTNAPVAEKEATIKPTTEQKDTSIPENEKEGTRILEKGEEVISEVETKKKATEELEAEKEESNETEDEKKSLNETEDEKKSTNETEDEKERSNGSEIEKERSNGSEIEKEKTSTSMTEKEGTNILENKKTASIPEDEKVASILKNNKEVTNEPEIEKEVKSILEKLSKQEEQKQDEETSKVDTHSKQNENSIEQEKSKKEMNEDIHEQEKSKEEEVNKEEKTENDKEEFNQDKQKSEKLGDNDSEKQDSNIGGIEAKRHDELQNEEEVNTHEDNLKGTEDEQQSKSELEQNKEDENQIEAEEKVIESNGDGKNNAEKKDENKESENEVKQSGIAGHTKIGSNSNGLANESNETIENSYRELTNENTKESKADIARTKSIIEEPDEQHKTGNQLPEAEEHTKTSKLNVSKLEKSVDSKLSPQKEPKQDEKSSLLENEDRKEEIQSVNDTEKEQHANVSDHLLTKELQDEKSVNKELKEEKFVDKELKDEKSVDKELQDEKFANKLQNTKIEENEDEKNKTTRPTVEKTGNGVRPEEAKDTTAEIYEEEKSSYYKKPSQSHLPNEQTENAKNINISGNMAVNANESQHNENIKDISRIQEKNRIEQFKIQTQNKAEQQKADRPENHKDFSRQQEVEKEVPATMISDKKEDVSNKDVKEVLSKNEGKSDEGVSDKEEINDTQSYIKSTDKLEASIKEDQKSIKPSEIQNNTYIEKNNEETRVHTKHDSNEQKTSTSIENTDIAKGMQTEHYVQKKNLESVPHAQETNVITKHQKDKTIQIEGNKDKTDILCKDEEIKHSKPAVPNTKPTNEKQENLRINDTEEIKYNELALLDQSNSGYAMQEPDSLYDSIVSDTKKTTNNTNKSSEYILNEMIKAKQKHDSFVAKKKNNEKPGVNEDPKNESSRFSDQNTEEHEITDEQTSPSLSTMSSSPGLSNLLQPDYDSTTSIDRSKNTSITTERREKTNEQPIKEKDLELEDKLKSNKSKQKNLDLDREDMIFEADNISQENDLVNLYKTTNKEETKKMSITNSTKPIIEKHDETDKKQPSVHKDSFISSLGTLIPVSNKNDSIPTNEQETNSEYIDNYSSETEDNIALLSALGLLTEEADSDTKMYRDLKIESKEDNNTNIVDAKDKDTNITGAKDNNTNITGAKDNNTNIVGAEHVNDKIANNEDNDKTANSEDNDKTANNEDNDKTANSEDNEEAANNEDNEEAANNEDNDKTANNEDNDKTANNEDRVTSTIHNDNTNTSNAALNDTNYSQQSVSKEESKRNESVVSQEKSQQQETELHVNKKPGFIGELVDILNNEEDSDFDIGDIPSVNKD